MTSNMRKAVDQLLTGPDIVVAQSVGVQIRTLRRWMKRPDFSDSLREAEQRQARELARLARAAAMDAALSLCRNSTDSLKPDAKIALELLKLSRAYEQTDGEIDALTDIIRQTSADE